MEEVGTTMKNLNVKCVSKAPMYHALKLVYHLNLLVKNVEEYV